MNVRKHSDSTLWQELGKLIELPKDCRKFTLTYNVGEMPRVEAECFVRGSAKRGVVVKRYKLVEEAPPS